MEIATGVHALPLEFEYGGRQLTIHPAALETDRGLVLVDVGLPGAAEQIRRHLADVGHDLDDVWLVFLTHQDGDHVAGLEELLAATDAAVAAPRGEAPYIDGRRDPLKADGERYPPVPVDIEVVDGVTLRTAAGKARLVGTPGHTPDHVSVYLPDERLLIAGDALTAEDGLAGPSEEFTLDMDAAARSVDRLGDLDVDRTLCHHGGFVEAGADRIREIGASLRK